MLAAATVLPLAVAVAVSVPGAARIIRTCVPLLPGVVTTCTAGNPEDECQLTQLAAGNTNRLYCLSRARGDRYLVREFGTVSVLRFDRAAENAIFAQLSRQGLAPALIATFPGGRIEGWLEGGPVSVAACRTAAVYEQVAEALVALHAFQPASSSTVAAPAVAWGWRAVGAWLPAAIERQRELVVADGEGGEGGERGERGGAYVERVAALRLLTLSSRLGQLRELIEARGPPRCYCHNDLSNTNLHLDPSTGALRLIDFEYGGFNYRGFDLATHLSHWAGGATDGRYDHAAFPRGAALGAFLAAYTAHAACGTTAEELLDEVRLSEPLAHAVWALWAVCSLPEAETRPFSHIEYAERRLAAFEASLRQIL